MNLEYVEWLDSYGCGSDWADIENVQPKRLICKSVGWTVAETDDCLVVVPHIHNEKHPHADPQGCGDMTIPKVAIVRREKLPIPVTLAAVSNE